MNEKYPSKTHAIRVKNHFLQSKESEENAAIFVSGENLTLYPYSDQTAQMRQNRYFFYLSGCEIPGAHILFDFKSEKLTLFLPPVDQDDVMWSGMPISPSEAMEKYQVDEVVYQDEIPIALEKVSGTVYTTDVNFCNSCYSKFLTAQDPLLFLSLDECRMIKDDFEISLMKRASKISDTSHLAVMSALPIETNEGHMHAEFMYHSMRQGSKFQSYDPICCSGPNCGTLHYVKNDDDMSHKNSVLIDAGAEWSCYASDVTRCFPINGEWTKEHREIYDAVLDMQTQTMELIKDGAHWDELHILAHRILIDRFLELGIFKGDKEEIFKSKVSVSFFPHGLGHLLGMDTHDVGGRPNYSDPDPMLRYLRLRRTLQAGMVLTDEPGIYFSPFLLKDSLEDPSRSKFIVQDALAKYMPIGGVRIEDDILVTEDGYENFTKVTSDPDEISRIVKAGLVKKREEFHCLV